MNKLLILFFKWQVFFYFCLSVHALEISHPSIEDIISSVEKSEPKKAIKPTKQNTKTSSPPPQPAPTTPSTEKYICTKTNHSNFRKGPSPQFPVEYKIMAPNYPLLVLKEVDAWFGVKDFEGKIAWVSQINVKEKCGGIINHPSLAFAYLNPSTESKIIFSMQRGYLIPEVECTLDWCKAKIRNKTVWIQRTDLWGKLD